MNNKRSLYPSEELSNAVWNLAVGRGRIKERLYIAYIDNLNVLNTGKEMYFKNYSTETIDSFNEIISMIEKHKHSVNVEDFPGGIAQVFIDMLTTDEAVEIAMKICDLSVVVDVEFGVS